MKGRITVEGMVNANKRNKNLTFLKNNALFESCILKINNTFIDNAEYLDIVMLMYNLLEYSDSYSMASGSLWNCYRNKINYDANETDANQKINNSKATTRRSFEKTKMVGGTPADNNTLDTQVVFPLKYLSNLWRSLDLPLTVK